MSSSPTVLQLTIVASTGSKFQSAVAHELFSDGGRHCSCPQEGEEFQSAVAHELFSDAGGGPRGRSGGPRFKALSRMSSSPTRARELRQEANAVCFKALSRMSSSPTEFVGVLQGGGARFQSAVAHELFSDRSHRSSGRAGRGRVSKRCRA